MFVTYADSYMECVCKFCHITSTHNFLQWNLCPGYWAVTKRITTFPSTVNIRNLPETSHFHLHWHYWWWILGSWVRTWNRALEAIDFFLTLKALCIRNLFQQNRPLVETSVSVFWGCWRKRPIKWHNSSWALHHDSALSCMTLLVQQFLTSTKMTVIAYLSYSSDFFLFPKMKLEPKGPSFQSIIKTQVNRRMWWRCWHRMTCTSVSVHGNSTGMPVLTLNWTSYKEM
jgi:hypothetical protein